MSGRQSSSPASSKDSVVQSSPGPFIASLIIPLLHTYYMVYVLPLNVRTYVTHSSQNVLIACLFG